MTRSEIIDELERIATAPGFVYALAILLRRELFFDPAEAADIDWRSRLNVQELSLLIGLMVKREINLAIPDEGHIADTTSRLMKLFEELHQTYNEPFLTRMKDELERTRPNDETRDESRQKSPDTFFASGTMMIEPIFYGGDGAYDFQYLDLANSKYADDAPWLSANVGFSIADVIMLAPFLKKRCERIHNTRRKPESFQAFCTDSLSVFTFSSGDATSVIGDKAGAFLKAFSLRPGTVNRNFSAVGQYNSFTSHPIIDLGDDTYFLPIGFLLAQSLYESPFYWMFQDRKYRDVASKHRGMVTEAIAYSMLMPVFGDNLFQNIQVIKSKKSTATDIDILAVAGNKAIVFQAKSKRLTELARRGDDEALKKDFSSAVQDAYDQALICRDAILTRDSKLCDAKGREIRLSESIDDVYIVCLTSDDYPALTNQIDAYLIRGESGPAPVGLSLFDLEIVAFYLSDPFEFAYYLRQRTTLSDYFHATSEIAFLGFHLRLKLFRTPDADMVSIDQQFAQLIDANFPVHRDGRPSTDATKRLHTQWKNEKFDLLVQQVKESGEPGFTDAVFYLYDIAGDGADQLISAIEMTLANARRDGKKHDFSMSFGGGKSGISFIAQASSERLEANLIGLSKARKYKTRADVWLGMASVIGSARAIDAIAFSKRAWEFDIELQRLMESLFGPGRALSLDGRKVGRNQPCPCGSRKKYKKCCGR